MDSAQHAALGAGGGAGGGTPAAAAATTPQVPQSAHASDFHKQFPQVPASENIVHEFQCSLSRRKLLRVGRLYLTPVRLCFSSMLVEPVMLPWSEVENCEKKSLMLFDQIIVTPTDKSLFGGELCFTGFMNGAATPFTTIKMLWDVRKKYAKSNSSVTAPSHTASGPAEVHAASAPNFMVDAQHEAVNGSDGQPTPSDSEPVNQRTEPPVASASPTESASPKEVALTPPGAAPIAAKSPSGLVLVSDAPEEKPLPVAGDGEPPLPNFSLAAPAVSMPPYDDAAHASPPRGSTPSIDATSTEATQQRSRPVTPPAQPKKSPIGLSTSQDTQEPVYGNNAALIAAAAAPAAAAASIKSPQTQRATTLPAANDSPTAAGEGMMAIASDGTVTRAHRRTRSDDIANMHAASQALADTLKSFPTIPRTESILDSFQCSYVSGVHRIGKLHITSNYVLFHSVMIAEPVVVRLIDIASVEKSTAMLVLEGLTLTMKDGLGKFEFTSFMSRDKAYQMIAQLIATHDKVARSIGTSVAAGARPASPALRVTPDEVMQSPNASRGMEHAPLASRPPVAPLAMPPLAVSEAAASKPVIAAPAVPSEPKSAVNQFNTTTADPDVEPPTIGTLDDFDSLVPTDYGTGLSKPSLFLETPVTDEYKYPPGYTLWDLFKALFDDNAPVLRSYRELRRETELNWEQWRVPVGAKSPAPQCGQRAFRCNTVIRALLVEKYYPMEEFQRYAICALNGAPTMIYQTSGQASGVTFSDTFRAETLFVYTQVTDPGTGLPRVTGRMYMHIQFLKFSIVKGKIRSATTAELKEGMARFHDMTRDYLKSSPSKAGLAAAMKPAVIAGAAAVGTLAVATKEHDDHRSVQHTASHPPAVAHPSTPMAVTVPGVSHAPSRHQGVVAATAAGDGIFQLPADGNVKTGVLVLYGLGVFYLLRFVWAAFWFAAPDLPPTLLDAAVSVDASALHNAIASVAIANFLAYVLRPLLLGIGLCGVALGLSVGSRQLLQ